MPENFDDILNKCLERVLRGESPEQCVKDYPQQEAELKPLLELALTVHKAALVEPRPEFKAQLRYQLSTISHAPEQKGQRRRGFFSGWQHHWAIGAAVLLIFIILLGGGTVAASTNSLPDQPLYPVKLATEQVQLTFTFSDIGKARLHVKFIDRRVKEIVLMAERGRPDKLQKLSVRLAHHLEKIEQLVGTESTTPQATQEYPAREKKIRELRQLIRQNAAQHQIMLREVEIKALSSARPDNVANAVKTSQMDYESALQIMGIEPIQEQQ